jgi:hypothetical protein
MVNLVMASIDFDEAMNPDSQVDASVRQSNSSRNQMAEALKQVADDVKHCKAVGRITKRTLEFQETASCCNLPRISVGAHQGMMFAAWDLLFENKEVKNLFTKFSKTKQYEDYTLIFTGSLTLCVHNMDDITKCRSFPGGRNCQCSYHPYAWPCWTEWPS